MMKTALPIALMLCCIAACTPESQSSLAKKAIVYCSESDPHSFNPQLDTSKTTTDATSHQLYERLLDYAPDSGQIVAGLASSWQAKNNGLIYIFDLRKNVSFHQTPYFTPSRHFNAYDVLFSINRWRDPNHRFHSITSGQYPYFDSLKLAHNISDVKLINDHRVEIHLKQSDSSFLAHLATDFAVVLSAEYGQQLMQRKTPQLIDTMPIGTGPFKFVAYQQRKVIRYSKHETYWNNTARVEDLIFDITPKGSVRLAKLITGECDAIAFPSQFELSIIREKNDLVLQQKPGLNIGFWAFNTQKPPFDNPQVRRALAHAIDKNTLLDTVYLGSAKRAKTLIPDASWAFNMNASDTAYNPVRARKLLDEAGVPLGFKMTIWAMPVERAYNPNARKMAELLRQYLADVQIDAEIISYDWTSFRQRLRNGEHDSVLIGWSADNGDPDNFYRPLLTCDAIPSGTNRAMWCNAQYDQLIYQALETTDINQRQAIYAKVNTLLYELQPLVPIAHALQYQAHRNELNGFEINSFGGIRFSGVTKDHD